MDPDEIVADAEQESHFERSTNKRHLSDDENEKEDEEEEVEKQTSHKRPRLGLHDASPSRRSNLNQIGKHPEGVSEMTKESPRARPDRSKPDFLNRNNRLFGALVGHLGQAKQNLEKESDKIKKQKQLQLSVSEKRMQDVERKKDTEERLANANKLRSQISSQINNFEKWKASCISSKNHFRTSTAPHLLWLPKQHNQKTASMLQIRQEEVNDNCSN